MGLDQIPIFWSATRKNNNILFYEIRREEDLISMFNEYKDLKKCQNYVTLADAILYSVERGGGAGKHEPTSK